MENSTDNTAIREAQISFIQACMEQNLEHLRHVENERLSFTSIYMALVAGAYAFIFGLEEKLISIFILIGLLILGALVLVLIIKWNKAFCQHRENAKRDYELLRKHLFNYDEGCVDCEGKLCMTLKENFPFYAINIQANDKKTDKSENLWTRVKKTSTLFIIFQSLIMGIIFATIIYFLK